MKKLKKILRWILVDDPGIIVIAGILFIAAGAFTISLTAGLIALGVELVLFGAVRGGDRYGNVQIARTGRGEK